MTHGGIRARAVCPACGEECAVSVGAGELRRHPKGSPTPCRGSGRRPVDVDLDTPPLVTPRADQAPAAPVSPPRRLAPGLYRPLEPMLDPATPCPPGHVTVAIVMHVPYDGSNGRSPAQEAAALYEDPAYLYRVMDTVPNAAIRLALKVHPTEAPRAPDLESEKNSLLGPAATPAGEHDPAAEPAPADTTPVP